MDTFEIRLFGRVELEVAGRPVKLSGRQVQALLALLALEPGPRPREVIAAALWPEADGPSSAACLRQTLWLLRGAISAVGGEPDLLLATDPLEIGLRTGAPVTVDVAAFERDRQGPPVARERALARYRGDLAEGLYQEFLAFERERLRDTCEDLLARVAVDRRLAGDLAGAREAVTALLRRDPLREEAHLELIRLHTAGGQRSQALRQYQRMREILARELGVAPLPETEREVATLLGLPEQGVPRASMPGLTHAHI